MNVSSWLAAGAAAITATVLALPTAAAPPDVKILRSETSADPWQSNPLGLGAGAYRPRLEVLVIPAALHARGPKWLRINDFE